MRFISYKVSKEVIADLKKIYTANTEELGLKALNDFDAKWGQKMQSVTNILKKQLA